MTDKTVDMSAEAVTNRMLALDSLWELSVALKSSRIVDKVPQEPVLKELDSEELLEGTKDGED